MLTGNTMHLTRHEGFAAKLFEVGDTFTHSPIVDPKPQSNNAPSTILKSVPCLPQGSGFR